MGQQSETLPDVETLSSAVIRLMARCAEGRNLAEIRTLVALLRELRAHPHLPHEPAVLASLAEAHAIWVRVLSATSEDAALAEGAASTSTVFH